MPAATGTVHGFNGKNQPVIRELLNGKGGRTVVIAVVEVKHIIPVQGKFTFHGNGRVPIRDGLNDIIPVGEELDDLLLHGAARNRNICTAAAVADSGDIPYPDDSFLRRSQGTGGEQYRDTGGDSEGVFHI